MHALFFDLDGTLLDTLEDIARAGNAILDAHGYPTHSLSEYRQLVGNGFSSLIRHALPHEISENTPEDVISSLVLEARRSYKNNLWHSTRPYAGMHDALLTLSEAGHTLCVLSNKPHELTVPLIKHFFPDVPFDQVIGGRDGFPLKPDPTVLLNMLHNTRIPAARAMYVGDSNVDIFTARNAGIRSVGVAWGFRGDDELRAANADHIITTPDQLAYLIQRNGESE